MLAETEGCCSWYCPGCWEEAGCCALCSMKKRKKLYYSPNTGFLSYLNTPFYSLLSDIVVLQNMPSQLSFSSSLLKFHYRHQILQENSFTCEIKNEDSIKELKAVKRMLHITFPVRRNHKTKCACLDSLICKS